MRSDGVVQHDDGTPTGSRSTSFFIRGILGPDAWSIFMRVLRRLAERFSVAASLVGHPGDGWRFRPGCSIGRTLSHASPARVIKRKSLCDQFAARAYLNSKSRS